MYMKKKVDKGTASRSLLLYWLKTKCLGEGVRGLVRWGRTSLRPKSVPPNLFHCLDRCRGAPLPDGYDVDVGAGSVYELVLWTRDAQAQSTRGAGLEIGNQ